MLAGDRVTAEGVSVAAQAVTIPTPPQRRVSVPGGIVDSGLSSLGSFLMGLLAARDLTASALGAYALFYSAYLLGSAISVSLVFGPIELAGLTLHRPHRQRIFGRSLRLGPGLTTSVGLAVCSVALLVPSTAPLSTRLPLALTAAALTAVSPLQDHVRRVLHASGRSWTAASMSGVLLATTALTLGILLSSPIPKPWIPFLGLAIGNLVSLVAAFTILHARGDGEHHQLDLSVRTLTRKGRWLLLGATGGLFCGFVMVALLTAMAGSAAAGYAEAARVLAQPVTVLAIGLLSVFNPEIMAATQAGRTQEVWRTVRHFLLCVTAASGIWLVVVSVRWPGNPLPHSFPSAYAKPGLLELLIVSETVGYAAIVFSNALFASGRERYQAMISLATGAISIIVMLICISTGAYALGLGSLAGSIFLHLGGGLGLRRVLSPRESPKHARTRGAWGRP